MKIFNKIKVFALDVLFPIACLSCGRENDWLCGKCLDKIPLKTDQICPLCEKKTTPEGRVCFSCRKKSSLAGMLVASSYKDEIISSAVHFFKYRFAQDLHIPLGKILLKSLLNSQLPLPDFILPVPLHPRRLRWRGFNQSELLAKYVAENLTPGFPIAVLDNFLLRQKYTRPQMEIKKYSRRKKNIENAFSLNSSEGSTFGIPTLEINPEQLQLLEHCNNYNVLLVDDIATTGSTLFECAKVLKTAGAAEVFAVVIARQETKK